MNVSIVTCWYAHPELASDYIYAVEEELDSDDEVIVIDNGGTPTLPLYFRVAVTLGGQLGFAKGSNLGLRKARNEATVFLNNDIKIGRRGWLDDIKEALEPGVLVGPLRNPYHAQVDGHPMPYLDGWCLGGMTGDLLNIGGFDEELQEPAYYSDNILCLEARAAGMSLRDVRVGLVHKLNVTAGPPSTPEVVAASETNRARYIARARELLVAA